MDRLQIHKLLLKLPRRLFDGTEIMAELPQLVDGFDSCIVMETMLIILAAAQ